MNFGIRYSIKLLITLTVKYTYKCLAVNINLLCECDLHLDMLDEKLTLSYEFLYQIHPVDLYIR